MKFQRYPESARKIYSNIIQNSAQKSQRCPKSAQKVL